MKRKYCISVIIPSFNSRNTIDLCLNSILNQSYKGAYEIIVVDSSNDGTGKIIKDNFPTVKLIALQKKALPGEARNIGIIKSHSDYIAFTDADCIVDYYWLENIFKRLECGKFDGIGGVVANGTPNSISGTLGYLNEFSFYLPHTKPGFVESLGSGNVCYKRDIFDKIKFLESSFAGEDTVFHWSIIDIGGKLFLDPSVKVTHLNRKGLMKVVKHQNRMGKGASMARILMKRDLLLIEHPIICILVLPFVRLLRMYHRVFMNDKKLFKKIIFFFLLSIIISYSWSFGFVFEALTNRNIRAKSE
ncbi:glycosyltransferase [Thermodesulfobacteriota bacterium]